MENKLGYTEGRIIVQVDMEYKNSVAFADGTKIRLERKYDNFDQKYTQPVNAIVISGKDIPEGSEILIHHNATHATNFIHNYKPLSGKNEASDIKYYSILETEAFAWRNGDEWQPLPGYDFALRVFRPYFGPLDGIEPTQIKNTLYLTTGEYKGLICHTVKAADYEIIFQDTNGRERRLLRTRTNGDPKRQMEEEVVAINHKLTEELYDGKIYVGLNKSDAKPVNELTHA
jgi:hypothetical protein